MESSTTKEVVKGTKEKFLNQSTTPKSFFYVYFNIYSLNAFFMNTSHWSFDHFCSYVLLCLASSDHDLDENELQTVKDFLDHQDIKNPEALIHELLVVIKYQTEEDRMSFIMSNFKKFVQHTEDSKSMMDAVEELIISDFTIAPDEMEIYRMMKKMTREIN